MNSDEERKGERREGKNEIRKERREEGVKEGNEERRKEGRWKSYLPLLYLSCTESRKVGNEIFVFKTTFRINSPSYSLENDL